MVEKLERKFGRFAIRGLMKYVILVYIVGFIAYKVNPEFYYNWLMLDIDRILEGQVWRILSFLIQPIEDESILLTVIMLFIYYSIGSSLEHVMGSFRFNLFYFSGILFNILAVVVIYIVTKIAFGVGFNYPVDLGYLNMSMFLVFAAIFPDASFYLMFLVPIKAKYMFIFYGVILGINIGMAFLSSDSYIMVVTNSLIMENKVFSLVMLNDSYWTVVYSGLWCGLISLINVLVSLMNFFLAFISMKKGSVAAAKRRMDFQHRVKEGERAYQKRSAGSGYEDDEKGKIFHPFGDKNAPRHKCCVCGRTEKDDDSLEFRFCTKCQGNYEYCSDHIYTHVHKTGGESGEVIDAEVTEVTEDSSDKE